MLAEGKKDIDRVTFKELKEKVSQYAAAMKKMGIKCGDRVVGKSIVAMSGIRNVVGH